METKRDTFFLQRKQSEKLKNKMKKQDEFDKSRITVNKNIEENQKSEKKPFDKKTYRLKKYSKKYKLEQWEEQRKKKLLHEYQKSIKNEPMVGKYSSRPFDDEPDSTLEVGKFVRHPDFLPENHTTDNSVNKKKKDTFQKAKEHFNKVKQQKLEKREEIEKAKEEKRQKLQEYKKKKHERFKKLSKKNKKGQPIMTGRLELLLEKLQKG